MKSILLVGVGRFGRQVAVKLSELRHEVLAVDCREERVNAVLPYVTNALIGDATDPDFLRTLGIDNFDTAIVTIGDNFQNSLEAVSLLKELGAKRVVARASSDVQEKFLLRNGADQVVYPERQMANWTAIRYSADHIFNYIDLGVGEEYSIFEVPIPEHWLGRSIGQIDIRKKYGITILALRQEGQLILEISSETLLTENQTMLILGSYRNIHRCFHI